MEFFCTDKNRSKIKHYSNRAENKIAVFDQSEPYGIRFSTGVCRWMQIVGWIPLALWTAVRESNGIWSEVYCFHICNKRSKNMSEQLLWSLFQWAKTHCYAFCFVPLWLFVHVALHSCNVDKKVTSCFPRLLDHKAPCSDLKKHNLTLDG